MKIVRFNDCASPGGRYGALVGDEVRLFPEGATLPGLLADSFTESSAETRALAELHVLEPTVGPVCLRDNVGFLQHVRNTRASRGVTEPLAREWSTRPAFYFANPWSVKSATAPVAIPPGSAAFDFEFEVGAVLGRGGADLSVDEAGRCIAGYVLYCDWSARDIQSDERVLQIGQGKGKDAAVSLGPWVLTADEAADIRLEDGFDFDASVAINGEKVTCAPFRGMDWSFEELVAYASQGCEVHPGDIIASGTVPEGCLLEQSRNENFRGWLQPGDTVSLTAGPLGEIRTVIQPPAPMVQWRRPPSGSA